MELNGKHITVAGLGKTGLALAYFLLRREAEVTVSDSAPEKILPEVQVKLRQAGAKLELGRHETPTFEQADLVVLSPGVPHTIAPVEAACRAGVPVIGEIELTARFITTPVVAVTGTNGKSTVTRLIGFMLEKSGLSVFVGGNLGTPLISYADGAQEADVVVAEISSFQLDTAETFHPAVGVLLNITADHLDRYPDLRSYGQAKAKLFERQTEDDIAVLNAEDKLIMELTRNIRARRCLFNISAPAQCGAMIKDEGINLFFTGRGGARIEFGDNFPPGRHNLENAAAAALAAFSAGASFEGIAAGLREFVPDPHRMQWVACINGVDYYDDSKATNVDAVARAVEAFRPPVILILGGRDKGGGYKGLTQVIQRRVKAMVLMGEAADCIDRELGGIVETRRAASMDDAVAQAAGLAPAGGTVLLSPACSSFDMYENYASRGKDFQRAVHSLGKDGDGKQQGNI
ncbi:MAG: UDP-N-acetylmuramoyl-L-alanine--D-glutamate ligase [Desulfobacteraceae bacterium]|nr:UDP-N-acetylmuramoyl-L-alanine--D-glutamate ligase [Desulfobacteraceae bacterium]